jgi:hypothetical protein
MKILSIISLLTLLTLNVPAQLPRIPFLVSFEITASMQNPNVTTTAATVTVPAFTKSSITTKSLLPIIARDENEEGNYEFTNFPAGSMLIFLADPTNFEDSTYVVEDKDENILVDASDLLTLEPENGVVINSFVKTLSTGLYKTLNTEYVGVVTFDDSGAGGTTQFAISYLVNATTTQTVSNKGVTTETARSKLSPATGTALLNGVPAVLTAPAQTLNGKVTVSVSP